MYIILTETIDLLLCALYGYEITTITTGLPTIINMANLLGRGLFVTAGILAKILEASVFFYAVGAGISSVMNSTGVVASGYMTWYKLIDHSKKLKKMN